jgi:hypothetical protein
MRLCKKKVSQFLLLGLKTKWCHHNVWCGDDESNFNSHDWQFETIQNNKNKCKMKKKSRNLIKFVDDNFIKYSLWIMCEHTPMMMITMISSWFIHFYSPLNFFFFWADWEVFCGVLCVVSLSFLLWSVLFVVDVMFDFDREEMKKKIQFPIEIEGKINNFKLSLRIFDICFGWFFLKKILYNHDDDDESFVFLFNLEYVNLCRIHKLHFIFA